MWLWARCGHILYMWSIKSTHITYFNLFPPFLNWVPFLFILNVTNQTCLSFYIPSNPGQSTGLHSFLYKSLHFLLSVISWTSRNCVFYFCLFFSFRLNWYFQDYKSLQSFCLTLINQGALTQITCHYCVKLLCGDKHAAEKLSIHSFTEPTWACAAVNQALTIND